MRSIARQLTRATRGRGLLETDGRALNKEVGSVTTRRFHQQCRRQQVRQLSHHSLKSTTSTIFPATCIHHRHLSHTTPTGTNNSDDDDQRWNRFRQPITRELWNEFQPEIVYTRSKAVNPQLYHQIYQEIQANIQNTWEDPEAAVPEYGPTGKWLYRFVMLPNENGETMRRYQRFDTGKENDGTNPTTVAELKPHEELVSMSLTPDETCVALLVQNGDQQQVRIRNVDAGQESTMEGTFGTAASNNTTPQPSSVVSVEWGAPIVDDKGVTAAQTLYLVLSDKQGRPCRVICNRIRPDSMSIIGNPINLYHSIDSSVIVDVQRTKGCQYVAIQALTKTSNEIHLCSNPLEPLLLVKPRADGVQYHLDVGVDGDVVTLVSDESINGGNFSMFETSIDDLPLEHIQRDPSQTLTADMHDDQIFFIEDMDLFKNYLILYERSTETGIQRIRYQQRSINESNESRDKIIDLSNATPNNVMWSKLSPVGNMFYNADSLRFQLESPSTPGGVFEYSFQEDSVTRISGSGEIENATIVRENISVKSQDGTMVPMSLFYDSEATDSGPVVLLGYGAYGESMDLGYDPSLSTLLKSGAVLAYAHTRGGGELGKSWYHAGRLENKPCSIDDFEACAMYLKSRFKGRALTSKVFSAGGILLGALVNHHPNLFERVVFTNAFVDVLHTMKNPSLFLTEHEYEEFGDPSSTRGIGGTIRSYCPVTNLDPLAHTDSKTNFLVIGTLDDRNVPYWNTTLYFQKLASVLNDGENKERRIYLDLQTEGGHNISGPNRIHVWALENAFLLDGMD